MPRREAGALSAGQLHSQASIVNGLHAGRAPDAAIVRKLSMNHPAAGRGRISPRRGPEARGGGPLRLGGESPLGFLAPSPVLALPSCQALPR
eukprot:9796510-Prorocentrum_lima.AAC.1